MSNPVTKLTKQKFPKNKNININNTSNNKNKIDPGIFQFLKKSQNSPKSNEESSKINKKKSLSENICNSIMHQQEEKNYIEENDKEIYLGAQKGLLYLLNELSKGKFFPEIDDFFDKMKDIKLQELRMKNIQKNLCNIDNNIKEDENSEYFKRKNSGNKHVTLNIQNKKEQNKSGEINVRQYSKSATKKRKILKDRSKNNIKISFKSDSKNNIKENSNIYENK
jgi:hypothetical protein